MVKKKSHPETVGQYLEEISRLRHALGFGKDEPWGPWFRGHQRHYWPLLPKLYRYFGDFKEIRRERIEDEIREEFIVRAPVLSEAKPAGNDDWEWYFLMRHFGAPTRLLDWTEGALLGLYFAVKDNPGLYDAAVWILDPFELNWRAIHRDEVIPPSAVGVIPADKRRVDPWLPSRFKMMKGLQPIPIAVYPTQIARRISTQRSCFTVHGTDLRGLDRLHEGSGCLRKITIPSYRTRPIMRELEACGIDEVTIFPDLAGLSHALELKWATDDQKPPHVGAYTRLRPSAIHKGGVGVFAIRRIEKGTPIFEGDDCEEMLWIHKGDVPKGPKEIRRLYSDFPVAKAGRLGCPTSFNRMTVAWYLNEPKKGEQPNVGCTEDYDFYALRKIEPGEELTVDYSKYSDEPQL